MKKILFILTLSMGVIFASNAQISAGALQSAVNKATTTAKAAGIDVNSLSSGIMTKLSTALALTSIQKPDVLKLVTNFLQQKSSILNLATTDKAKYTSKLAELTSGLTSKLKTVLTANQFTKFLGLKPQTNTPSNVLSQLFY